MQRQLDLFSAPRVGIDAQFRGVVRTELAGGAWVDRDPAWVAGHDALFDELAASLAWREESRRMYDRVVAVPRLLARVPPGHAVVEQMRAALAARYGEAFPRATAALYRDGRDSVAWHGDTTARELDRATVATVSLGEPRRFLLRPAAGGASVAFAAGGGALIVMGGTCQRTWRHAVPKAASAGPRIALMFRPIWDADGRDPYAI